MQKSFDHKHSPILIKINNLFKTDFHYPLRVFVLTAFLSLFSFCRSNSPEMISSQEDPFAYDLENPVERFKLPAYLEEISGLSYYGKGKIACVQDEKAIIYVLNLDQEKISKKYDFGEDGDYEDIVVSGKTAYVLRNNGHIYRIKNFKKKERKVKKFNTPLKEKNDTEGMAFDPLSNSLLIACKGSPSIHKEELYTGYKAIYRFDLGEKKLVETPHFLVDLERLDSYMDRSAFTRLSVQVAKRLRLVESETSFQPSGIAIHPQYGEIYIISSVGKLLIVLNRRGKVLDVKELDPKIFRQPEGICFSPGGDLFISNEGKGGKGYILKFKPHDKH
jgi:uncharacterized protein YjiK